MYKQWIEDPDIKFYRFSQNLFPFKIYVTWFAVYTDQRDKARHLSTDSCQYQPLALRTRVFADIPS